MRLLAAFTAAFTAALFAACASAPTVAPGRSAAFGYVRLVPREGVVPPCGGLASYGDREFEGVDFVDYSKPGFAVVVCGAQGAAGAQRSGDPALVIRDGATGAASIRPRGARGRRHHHGRNQSAATRRSRARGRSRAPARDGESIADPTPRHGRVVALPARRRRAKRRASSRRPDRSASCRRPGATSFAISQPGRAQLRAWHPRFPPSLRRGSISPRTHRARRSRTARGRPRRRRRCAASVAAIVSIVELLVCFAARAEDDVARERVEALERRNEELRRSTTGSRAAPRRARAARSRALHGRDGRAERLSAHPHRVGAPHPHLRQRQHRLLRRRHRIALRGHELPGLGRAPLPRRRPRPRRDAGRHAQVARNIGFSFEWNVVRLGELQDTDDPTGRSARPTSSSRASAAVAGPTSRSGASRFPSARTTCASRRATANNPFITNTVGGPWWWDEGVRVYGSDDDGRFGYVASISDGETPTSSDDASREPQFTLKLCARPTAVAARQRERAALGSTSARTQRRAGSGALWLGETWATPVGALAPRIPTWSGRRTIVPDGPNGIDSTTLARRAT